MSPTLENLIVLQWLRLIHPGLPSIVCQKYSTQIWTQTLASLKDDISQSLDSILEDVKAYEEANVMCSSTDTRPKRFKSNNTGFRPQQRDQQRTGFRPKQLRERTCPYCTELGKANGHFLSQCKNLPRSVQK